MSNQKTGVLPFSLHDKLLRLTLDLGGEKRNVFSGIRSAYPDPQALIGRHTIIWAIRVLGYAICHPFIYDNAEVIYRIKHFFIR